ncbi:lysylphosphatidylglycerol synthase transmembrane domain-containing protein [Angustibacter peucedani]
MLGGAAVLAVVALQLGPAPFRHAAASFDVRLLLAAAALGAVTTTCAAARWRLVARGLDVDVPLGEAVAACYRAQLLNATLPGGVLGDVHRAVRHGLRPVWWERCAGQLVQAALAALALLALPSGLGAGWRTAAAAALVVSAAAAGLLARRGLIGRGSAPAAVLALSALVVAGHVATFVLAARATGLDAGAAQLLPLALLVLVASGLPTNVAGWGPREGAAAALFAAAGLGGPAGLGASVVYGVLALVAALPGLLVLVADPLRRNRVEVPPRPAPVVRTLQGAARG